MDGVGDIFQLKVRLLRISPMIWRRVLVPSSITLRELHGVLQVAMGWEGIHLFAFDIYAVQYGSFELARADPRIALSSLDLRANDKFSYVYDMGAHWAHEVRVEKITTVMPKKVYPVCIDGSGACPPEDCGGPHGYLERRDEADGYDAWRDMEMMAEWLGEVEKAPLSTPSLRSTYWRVALRSGDRGALDALSPLGRPLTCRGALSFGKMFRCNICTIIDFCCYCAYNKAWRSIMPRLSIEITPEQQHQIKMIAAMNNKSIKDIVLERILGYAHLKNDSNAALKEFLEQRLEQAKAGETVMLSADDIRNQARARQSG